MADEIASLILKVESTGVAKATDALDNLTKSGLRAEDTAGALSDAWGGLGKSAQTATGYQDRYVQSLKRYVNQGKEAQEQAVVGFFKELDAIKQLSGGMKELERIQSQVQQAKNREAISQGDYLTLISDITAKKMLMRDAEDLETRAKVRFIQKLKEQVTAQKLSRAEMLRVQAAELGVSNAADVYIRKMEVAAKSTHSLGLKSAMARRELGVLIGELARGNLGALRGSSITLANRAGWIDKLFTLRGLGIAGVIGGIGAAVYGLGKAWYEGSQEAVEFNKQLILTGGYAGKTAGQLQDMARALAGNGVTQHDAAGVLAQVVGSGAFSGSDVNMVARTATRMKEIVGQSVDETINQFKRLKGDPVNAVIALNDSMHFLTLSQYKQIAAAQAQGDSQRAAELAMQSYAGATTHRLNDVENNLGGLEKAIKSATYWWGKFWDAALDAGREESIDQKIQTASNNLEVAQRALAELERGQNANAGPYGAWKSDDINRQKKTITNLKQHISELQSEKITQDVLNDAIGEYNKRQQDGINLQRDADALAEKYQTRKQRRDSELEKLAKVRSKFTQKKYDELVAQINEWYKDPKPPKPPKNPAYHDDEATRLLMQYREKGAKLQGEINNANLYSNQKLTESEKELLALETRIAGMKDKTLTAADKSILAHQKELEAALDLNVEKEKQLRNEEALNRLQAKSVQLAQQHRQELERLKAQGEFDAASVGMGGNKRQRAQEEFNLKQQFANVQEELDRSARKDGTYGSPEYFAQAAENAAALNEQLAQIKDNYANIDKAQGDWHAGAERAFQNFTENAMNVAGTTEQAFNLTFSSMTNGLETFVTTGKMNFRSFVAELLAGLAKIMAQMAVMQAATGIGKWLGFIGGAAGGAASGMGSGTAIQTAAANWSPFAKGGAVSSPDLSMYSGQILTQPTFFKFARGGVAGEAGPEAILPLARDSRGYMGVRLADKGGKQQIPTIQITVTQHIDQRGTDQNDQAAAQRNNQQLAKMVSDLVDTKVNRALDTAMRPGGKLAGVS